MKGVKLLLSSHENSMEGTAMARYESWSQGRISDHYDEDLLLVRKYGINIDVDATPEDIWRGGGTYSFLSSAATVNIVSSSANDAAAGTGAQTVVVEYLDSDWVQRSVTLTMNGTHQVDSSVSCIRVNRAYVDTAGSGNINAGTITVKGGSTTQITIAIGVGQSQLGIYSVPYVYGIERNNTTRKIIRGIVGKAQVHMAAAANTQARIDFFTRDFGKAWRMRRQWFLDGATALEAFDMIENSETISPKMDLRPEATMLSGSDGQIIIAYDVIMQLGEAI